LRAKEGERGSRFRGFNGGGAAHKKEAPQSIKISVKRVPPLKKGVPEGQGIDCLEEAEFCRMRTGKCGIDGRTSGTDGMLSAT